ncbi:hypothetical protein AYK26_06160 [Euryarchaeota archaeon SM23-78]|nr:MAG: hypothetical protein AYK26_06160 [Euryarchaeota archaeon SM23-78]MBW3001210.1 hypothetical protein [Candidatus Woesearchaeota archaeon]
MGIKLRAEEEAFGYYAASYGCGDGKIKVARLGKGMKTNSPLMSALQIQKVDFKFCMEGIEFREGKAKKFYYYNAFTGQEEESKDQNKLEEKVKQYAKEFKEVFKKNKRLKKRVETHFADVNKHIDWYSSY